MSEINDRAEEMDDRDFRSRLVNIEHLAHSNVQRLGSLEAWKHHSEVAVAVKDEQFKHMDARFSTLDNKMDAINNSVSWIGKLIAGAVVMAIVAFIINGGLKIPV